jgi:putative transposase
LEGEIVLKYLDESGFCLCLPPSYTWTRKGTLYQHRVRTRWGSKGRINLIGTLCLEGDLEERLEYSLIEGSCRSGEVKDYLDALAEQAQRMDKACVVVLDNAPFHTSGMIREREEEWAAKGLRLYRLPAYCPHLNLIESIWHTLKGFLLPRRFYDSVGELKQAVLHALSLLRAVEVQCSLGGT